MSSLYPKGGVLYFRVKVDGKWVGVPTGFRVGQEKLARKTLAAYDAKQAAGESTLGELGPVTVNRAYTAWLKTRKLDVPSWKNDRATMRLHVLPELGTRRLDQVTPSDVKRLVMGWRRRTGGKAERDRTKRRMAPRTVYSAYSTVCAFFRDAAIDGLIDRSPCMLTKRELGPKVDKNPEWRPTAKFGRAELEALISDERVPLDRRVLYGLLGVGGVRYGEASGLFFRNVAPEPDLEPVPMLWVAYAYERPLPKGGECRPVPIHPTLAALLAEWKLSGWAAMFGRPPTGDDLVVPLPPGVKSKKGPWRRKSRILRSLKKDLEVLGFRDRRGHDLRRTMISLSRSDGAVRDIHARATHLPPKEVREGYTTFEWDVVCREVLKLKVALRGAGKVLALGRATGRATSGGEAVETTSAKDDPAPVRVRGAPLSISADQRAADDVPDVCEHCGTPRNPAKAVARASLGSKVASLGPRLRALQSAFGGRR